MKPSLHAAMLAEGVSVDQLTGRVTAFNMLDHVKVAKLPTYMARICAIAIYELSDESDRMLERVRLLSPQGTELRATTARLDLGSRKPGSERNHHRSLHLLWGVTFESEGDHRVVIEHQRGDAKEWETVDTIRLAVVLGEHPFSNVDKPAKG